MGKMSTIVPRVNNSEDYIGTFLDSTHANAVLSRRESKTCPELEFSVAMTALWGLFKSNLAPRHSHPHLYNIYNIYNLVRFPFPSQE